MTKIRKYIQYFYGHRVVVSMVLCLFGLCLANAFTVSKRHHRRQKQDQRIYLVHSDELKYDMFGPNPDAQIAKGHVHFRHQGANLTCDSAYFYEQSNSMRVFGHVHFVQGDSLSLRCDRAF